MGNIPFSILFLLLMSSMLFSCKLKIGNLDAITPHFDRHMHGPGSKPTAHSHSAAHKHTFVCDYKGKEYESTLDCGNKHMHGSVSAPHRHLSDDKKHGQGFSCQHQGKGRVYTSDKDCFQHFHGHIHGLKLTKYDLHGRNTESHVHDHKHTGDHAHESPGYKCYGIPSNKPCDIFHSHAHMHGEGKAHTHEHHNTNEHAHTGHNCITDGSHTLYDSNLKCKWVHQHEMVSENRGVVTGPSTVKHSHVGQYAPTHSHKCYYKGTSYPCKR